MQRKQTQHKVFSIIFFFSLAAFFSGNRPAKKNSPGNENDARQFDGPNEWFYLQRSYPDNNFDWNVYQHSLQGIQAQANDQSNARMASANGFNAPWTLEGPGNIGGRINVVAVHPSNQNIIYEGNAAGGIFKTTDGGITWNPIFDAQSYLAIGSIVFEPGNPNTIYVGTGDPNISGYPFIGNGIYKSTDAGTTWTHLGLSAASIISKIVVNPQNTDIVYAATMGIPFQPTTDRGLYKSIDGGLTWNNILFVSDSAGIIDLLMDFTNPGILYAASWNRLRNNQISVVHGFDAKIFKTIDGGTTWTPLTGGLPVGDFSRISLTMSGLNHNLIYASYADTTFELNGIYKTTDGGTTWNTIPLNGLSGPFNGQGWYSGGIKVNPANDDELFLCGVNLYKTSDGGNSWNLGAPQWWQYIVHADIHDVEYYSADTIYITTDGGMYKTVDGGQNWTDIENIPNNQFYHVTYDPNNIGIYAGGVQDNGTTSGNASLLNNWSRIYGGDGFRIIYHPTDPNTFYVETQHGGIGVTTDGGFSFNDATSGIDINDERNWDMPYIMSSGDPDLLYAGTTMVYRNFSGASASWIPISPPLVDPSFTNDPMFHTISCLAESNVNNLYLYAGTSDGYVWGSTDAGTTWMNITDTLPGRYVTCIKASKVNAAVAFVSHSGYKSNDFIPHIHKTTDNGTTWTDISSDLPQVAVNCILTDPGNDNTLFVGTDGGVYGTLNGGINWIRVGNNMPVIPVYELELDPNANRILAATHGRSLMSYSRDSILLSAGATDVSIPGINIYPNPASEYITIDLNNHQQTGISISIFSVNGDLIKSEMKKNGRVVISLKDFSPGVYLIRVKGEMSDEVKRFVKL